jgi:hypothetical protein
MTMHSGRVCLQPQQLMHHPKTNSQISLGASALVAFTLPSLRSTLPLVNGRVNSHFTLLRFAGGSNA